ncbi:MAG: helix-turn-helix domain-containing protein [Hyphomonadaceae bacterium]|nr:helix-turn-helix domain-containing protein [Hyphomonadaceae bacterium]
MSGVAKDETNPTSTSDETVSAVGDAEAGHAESLDSSETEGRGKRHVPHLRVVTDNEVEFTAPAAPVEAPHQRIGALIRATRENRGFTLDQVSKETRVHLSHLRAIEDMTPNLLGAPVYAKGYIRAYARHLGLDENTTLDRYLKECAILKDPEKQEIAPPSTGRKLPVTVPVFGFLIVALVGAAAYAVFANGGKTPAAPVVASATATDQVNPAAPDSSILAGPATATAPAAQQLRIVALKRALLEVRSASGDKYVRRDFEPGEAYTPRVGSGWTISTSDGSAFEWRLGDKSLGLVGDQPAPVNAQSVDLAATRPPIEVAPAIPAVTETAPATTPSTIQTPLASTAAPPPAKPKPATRPKPKPAAQPPAVAATPDVAAEAPPPVQAPKTPVQDPAQLAYPDQ